MKSWVKKTIFTLSGALLGLAYYNFFGCSGGCAVTSDPFMTVAFGAVIGWLASNATDKEEA